jgi:hypothetical protein
MILKRTLSLVSTFVTGGRKFIRLSHRAFISLLLTPLLSVGCARPTATAGNRASPLVYAAVGDSTGIGLGARDGGGGNVAKIILCRENSVRVFPYAAI